MLSFINLILIGILENQDRDKLFKVSPAFFTSSYS